MTDLANLTGQLAAERIATQLADRHGSTGRTRPAGPRRTRPRHAIARHLHRLADRLDA